MLKLVSSNSKETEQIGQRIGEILRPGDVICLSGDLGVGKTTLVKGLAKGLGIKDHLTSPTFTIVNQYEGKHLLYHFDVYRVNDVDELYAIGFEEYIYSEAVSVIEWAELISDILPKEKLWVEIKKDVNNSEDYRKIILIPNGIKYQDLINKLTLKESEDK